MPKTVLSFILGFAACGIIILTILFGYSKIEQANELLSMETKSTKMMMDTSQKITPLTMNDFKVRMLNLDEKISSTNKRFDDLYVLGGIIITLLIAINVGIFISVEHKVDKYFKDHFDSLQTSITNSEKEAGSLLGKIRTYHASLPNNSNNNSGQPTP